jgi:hypothetical protein
VTPADLRAAIAADCPHRLPDYDRHLADRQTTPAFVQLWREEHAISSRPEVEAELDGLYRQVETSADYQEIKGLLEQASQIRHKIREGLK